MTPPASAQPLMTSRDLLALPQPPADHTIAYGPAPQQLAELRLPKAPGPHPVVILVHGGCWEAPWGFDHVRSLAAALTAEGYATWSLEYRRLGDPGGGWPGTFEDVARGADHLREVARAPARPRPRRRRRPLGRRAARALARRAATAAPELPAALREASPHPGCRLARRHHGPAGGRGGCGLWRRHPAAPRGSRAGPGRAPGPGVADRARPAGRAGAARLRRAGPDRAPRPGPVLRGRGEEGRGHGRGGDGRGRRPLRARQPLEHRLAGRPGRGSRPPPPLSVLA